MTQTRRLAAILAADVAGYSRLTGADEEGTLARIRALRSELIDPALSANHGRIANTAGDSLLVEFASVVDAARAAIDIQRAMAIRNADFVPEKRLEFRIGVHLGDVVVEEDGDLMGDGVNIAARLEGIAKPGAIFLSEDAYRQVKGRFDLAASDLGERRLKNIADPVRVYSLEAGVAAEAKKLPAPALLAAGIAALLVAAAALAWYFLIANRPAAVATKAPASAASNAAAPSAAARFSIVVLPFTNLSGDAAQDYLADALTDELTTSIARIPFTLVIARNTAFTYKGKPADAKAIGKDLGVRYVLEGSVQPSAAQVRVNAQLVDADSGAHLWAEQFDAARADLLQTQDEIVTRLAHALQFQLTDAEAARLKRTPAANRDAEDLALQCLAAVRKAPEAVSVQAGAGFRLCEKALEIAANNVTALSVLSIKYWQPVSHGLSADPKGDLKRGDDLVSRALALYPDLAYGHVFKAEILRDQGKLAEADAEAERALYLDPTAVDAYAQLAFNEMELGRFEDSLQNLDKAIRLSPHDPSLHYWYSAKASALLALKQDEQAIGAARAAIAIDPTFMPPHLTLIAALGWTGRKVEAREALERISTLFPSVTRTIAAAKVLKSERTNVESEPRYLDYWDRVIAGLRKAGVPEE